VDALQAFAAAAGCAEVIEDAPDAQRVAAAMGTSCHALNVHATFAQLYAPDRAVRRVLAVAAGPGTPALLKELEELAAALRPADDADDVDVEAALDAHKALLGACAVFACDLEGDVFELAPRGTTLGGT
jgi:hypothetical protein